LKLITGIVYIQVFFHFISFSLIFILTTYSLKQDVIAQGQGAKIDCEVVSQQCEGDPFLGEFFKRVQTVSIVETCAARGPETGTPYLIYINFISNLFLYLITCLILCDDPELAEDQDA
jgi:hypothetical protein